MDLRGKTMFEKLKELLKRREKRASVFEKGSEKKDGAADQGTSFRKDCSEKGDEPLDRNKVSAEKKRPVGQKGVARGRHGLAVIDEDADLEALLEAEKGKTPEPPSRPKPKAPVKPLHKPAQKKKAKKRTKNGILVLEGEPDILGLMREEAQREEERVVGSRPRPKVEAPAPFKKVQKDKNGLPILGEDAVPSTEGSEDFASLLASSLSEKSEAVLLHEKRDRMELRKKPSVQERLKHYPSVQGELDLHGYTAAKADQTAELYVRRAYSVGTYTIRIIVGKGLHSEHGAVLPDVISDRLNTLRQDGIVLAWQWEKGKKSKSGAMIVYLNNYDTSRFPS